MIDRKGISNYLAQLSNSNIPKIPLRHLVNFISNYEGDFNKIDYFDHLSPQILGSMQNFISNLKASKGKSPTLEVWQFSPNGVNFLIFCCALNNDQKEERAIGISSYELRPFFAILQVDDCIYFSETGHQSSQIPLTTLYQIVKIGIQNNLFQDDSKISILNKDFSTPKIYYSSGVGTLVLDSKYLLKPQQAYSLTVEEISPHHFKEASPITTFSGDLLDGIHFNISTNIPRFSCVNLKFSYQITEMETINKSKFSRTRFCKEILVDISFTYSAGYELPVIIITKHNIELLKKHILQCIRQNNVGNSRNGKDIIFKKFTRCLLPSLETVMKLVSFGNQEMRKHLEQKYDNYCKYLFNKDEFMIKLEEHLQEIIKEREKEREMIGQVLFSSREEIII